MRAILDEATDPWGIKVTRVELKNILPPQDIQNSMEKQMKAERDRRQAILQAEGTKHSQILVAEGEKESAILRADAEKQAAILRAEGQAEAIRAVQKATAEAMKMLNDACPNDQVIKLKALETMQKVADGQATKIIIPSEIRVWPVWPAALSRRRRKQNKESSDSIRKSGQRGILFQIKVWKSQESFTYFKIFKPTSRGKRPAERRSRLIQRFQTKLAGSELLA